MNNRWGLIEGEGYESFHLALDERFERLMREARSRVANGGDKMILANKVEVQMILFMDKMTDLFDIATVHEGIETMRNTFCSEFGFTIEQFENASDEIDEICKLLKKRRRPRSAPQPR